MHRFNLSRFRDRTFPPQALLGAAALAFAGLVNAQAPADLTLQADEATSATNEVILKLNYTATTALARISPDLGKPRFETEVEAAVIQALNVGKSADLNAISPRASAQFLLTQNRMTDDERAEHELARSTGRIPADAYDPRLSLNQYIVVRTVSIDAAKALVDYAQRSGIAKYAQINRTIGLSAIPSDSFFSPPYYPVANHYQWGMHTMSFPAAWDVTKGHAYVGVLDAGFPGVATAAGAFTPHPDLANSFRPRMVSTPYSPTYGCYTDPYTNSWTCVLAPQTTNHTVHVSGIIGAQHGNGHGIAGGCPNCSVVPFPFATSSTSSWLTSLIAAQVVAAVDGGMQIINWSGGQPTLTCAGAAPVCDALFWAKFRDVLVVVSAGNDRNVFTPAGGPQFPGNLGDSYPVLPVGGIDAAGNRWNTGLPNSACCELGTNDPSTLGVMAPAALVVSTFNAGQEFSTVTQSNCSDNPPLDASFYRFSLASDGFGTCTGTSMSAPHITAAAALMRSVYPRASHEQIRSRLRLAGTTAACSTKEGLRNVSVQHPGPDIGRGRSVAPRIQRPELQSSHRPMAIALLAGCNRHLPAG